MEIGDEEMTRVEGEVAIAEVLEAASCRVAVMHMEEEETREEAQEEATKATMEPMYSTSSTINHPKLMRLITTPIHHNLGNRQR